uniref:PHD-type domain-containing protein n=1 Tax=Heliothis virescens TaxID=7102 RepID=A0A2A4J0K9_HELVI
MDSFCGGCNETLTDLQTIKCTSCNEEFHLQCVNIVQNDFPYVAAKWICPTCTGKLPRGDNTNKSVRPSLPSDESINVNSQPRSFKRANSDSPIFISDNDTNALNSLTREIRLMRHDMSQIKTQLNELTTSIKTCNSRLDSYDDRITQSENKIIALETQANKHILELNDTISQLRDQLNAQAQEAMSNEIEIMGISEPKNENVKHTVLLTAAKIGVDLKDDDVDWVSRIGIGHKSATGDFSAKFPRPIIVRLLRRNKRDELIKAAKTRKNLDSKDIVSEGPTGRVFINEHLTKQNRRLFRDARTKAQGKGFKFCWIRNGQILLRKKEGMATIRIQNMADIHDHLGPDIPEPSPDSGPPPNTSPGSGTVQF